MQDLVYLPLSTVKFPATTMYLYSKIIEVVTFDILPTDDWYAAWFNFPKAVPFSPAFEAFDFWSTNFIISVGSMWIFGIIMLLKYPLFYLIRGSKYRVFRWLEKSMREGLFWESPVDFMLTGYIDFTIAVLQNYPHLQ